jgi:hypothetical protein
VVRNKQNKQTNVTNSEATKKWNTAVLVHLPSIDSQGGCVPNKTAT